MHPQNPTAVRLNFYSKLPGGSLIVNALFSWLKNPCAMVFVSCVAILNCGVASFSAVSAAEPAASSTASSSTTAAAVPAGAWVTSIAPIGEGQFVAATADGLLLRESSVCRFSEKHPDQLEAIYAHPAGVWAVDASSDGKLIASSDYRGNLGVFTIDGGKVQVHEGVLERWTQALQFAPDGQSVVAGNEGGKLFVFDVTAGKVSKSIELGPQAIAAIAFSPDGTRIAASDGSGTVHLVSWPDFAATGKIKISEEATWGVAFADDNTIVVGSSDRNLYRCAATADAKPESILSGRDWITHLSISSSGQIAAAELGGAVHVTTLAGGGSQLSAPSSVWSVAWNGPSELFVGTRKNGVVIAAQSWTLAERAPEPPAKEETKEAEKPEEKVAPAAEAKPAVEESKPASEEKPATEVKADTEAKPADAPAEEAPAKAEEKSEPKNE